MVNAPASSIEDIVTDFLGSAPTLQEIAAYRLPSEIHERAHQLLDKNCSGNLTDEERAEMEKFRRIDHLLTLVKAKAKLNLKERPS